MKNYLIRYGQQKKGIKIPKNILDANQIREIDVLKLYILNPTSPRGIKLRSMSPERCVEIPINKPIVILLRVR